MTDMKRCSKCGIEKPLDAFYKDKTVRTGRVSYCKECKSVYDAEYRKRNTQKHTENGPDIKSVKVCSACKRTLNISEFYIEKIRADGYSGECKECRKKHNARLKKCVKIPNCKLIDIKAETLVFECEVCGKEFRRYKSVVDWEYENAGRSPKFCSHECHNASMRKGYKSYNYKKIERRLHV